MIDALRISESVGFVAFIIYLYFIILYLLFIYSIDYSNKGLVQVLAILLEKSWSPGNWRGALKRGEKQSQAIPEQVCYLSKYAQIPRKILHIYVCVYMCIYIYIAAGGFKVLRNQLRFVKNKQILSNSSNLFLWQDNLKSSGCDLSCLY